MMDETEKVMGYLGGFFDGEGSISAAFNQNTGNYGSIYVKCSQRDPRPLQAFQELWGGRIYEDGPVWAWMLMAQEPVEEFLQAILPYLVVKRLQASLALHHLGIRGVRKARAHVRYTDDEIATKIWLGQKISQANKRRRLNVR